jgi:hypothetical protein
LFVSQRPTRLLQRAMWCGGGNASKRARFESENVIGCFHLSSYPGGWRRLVVDPRGFGVAEEEARVVSLMRATSSTRVAPPGAPGSSSSSFMDDVKLGAGDRRKAAEAAPGRNGAPGRPQVLSETGKGNAAAPGGQRREAASRFKPAAPSAPTRRSTSPSPARESCNRAQSAGKARPATTSAAPLSSQLKPSALASPARDAGAEARGTPRATSAKAPDGLWASARNSSPSRRTESAPAPTKKIDRLVRGLPSSEVAKAKVQADATPARKRSPVRRNSTGNQCENACPSESPATKRVVEQHRWPAMTGGRGSAGLTSASTAPSTGNASRSLSVTSSNPSAGHFPMKKMRPSEGTGKCLSPSSEMAKRAALRQSRREDADSDASSQTSEGSKSACRPSRAISVPVLRRSSSPSKVASFAASKACQSPSRIRASAPCRSKCSSSAARQGAAQPVSNYMADPRKGKKTENQVENIHRLRLLENRYLQWRFVNAISEATLSFRRNSAEV